MTGPIAILPMSVGPVHDQKLERGQPGQILRPPIEKLNDGVGDLSMPLVAGLVGAALQGSLGKMEKITTVHNELLTDDQEAADEQTSRESSLDEKEALPNAT